MKDTGPSATITDVMSGIHTEKLTRIYTLGKVRVTALDRVDFSVEEGEFVAVTGASGSGKSTLLNLLGGLDTPTSGMIEVMGKQISAMDKEKLALYRRFTVGMIFQAFNLITARTALENVELPLIFAGVSKKERRIRAAGLLEKVGLSGRSSHRPSELSGGEQQRVAIARALVNGPRILLADEPTGNLDSRTAGEVVRLLAGLQKSQGLTVVMVSHEQALAREHAGRIISLMDGRVQSDGVTP